MNFLLVAGVALVGSFVQAASGFGYAIICMALWPLILPFQTASIVELSTAFVMVIYISVRLWRHINFKILLWPFLASTLTSAVGVFTLMAGTESVLRRVLGGVLCLLAVYFVFFSHKLRIQPTRKNGIIAGAISGFCGGLFSIGGPPMVAYFLSVTDDKMEYNATLQFYFVLNTSFTFLLHLVLGNITGDVIRFGAVALIGLLVGTLFGFLVFKKLSMKALRRFVYTFMSCAGLYLLLGG